MTQNNVINATPGTAFTKSVTDNLQSLVASVSSSFTVGNSIKTADTFGTFTNGAKLWNQINIRFFANSGGPYVPTTGMQACIVEIFGPGGGGGGSKGNATGSSAGQGGGAGGYCLQTYTGADIGASVSFGGGVGGAAGASGGGTGGGGTDLTFKGLTATGGNGGGGDSSSHATTFVNRPGNAGAPGFGTGGLINFRGGAGFPGLAFGASSVALGGFGGFPSKGSGIRPSNLFQGPGNAGQLLGGGGSGGHSTTTDQAGAIGSAGYVLILEFIKA